MVDGMCERRDGGSFMDTLKREDGHVLQTFCFKRNPI